MIQKRKHIDPPGPKLTDSFQVGTNGTMEYMTALNEQFGDTIMISKFAKLYLINNPDDVRVILQTDQPDVIRGGPPLHRIQKALGTNLVTLSGASWTQRRAYIHPHFNRRHYPDWHPHIIKHTNDAIEKWSTFAKTGKKIDFGLALTELVLGITGSALFDLDLTADAKRLIRHIYTGSRYATKALSVSKWWPSPLRVPFFINQYRLKLLLQKHIEAKKEKGPGGTDLLSKLLEYRHEHNNRPLSQKELVEEYQTQLISGHETTGNVLSWLWYCLGRLPEVQDKVYQEADSLFNETLDFDLSKLNYTNNCINETMRLYPPLWITGRAIQKDMELSGYHFKNGSIFIICPYLLHRHKDYWENPNTFNPERFEKSQKNPYFKYTFLPFGLGPRSCIGQHFARVVMSIITAQVAKHFRITLIKPHEITPEPLITLRPSPRIMARLELR